MAADQSEILEGTPDLMLRRKHWTAREQGISGDHRNTDSYSIMKHRLRQLVIETRNGEPISCRVVLEAKS